MFFYIYNIVQFKYNVDTWNISTSFSLNTIIILLMYKSNITDVVY